MRGMGSVPDIQHLPGPPAPDPLSAGPSAPPSTLPSAKLNTQAFLSLDCGLGAAWGQGHRIASVLGDIGVPRVLKDGWPCNGGAAPT